jgi:hypothetical protein
VKINLDKQKVFIFILFVFMFAVLGVGVTLLYIWNKPLGPSLLLPTLTPTRSAITPEATKAAELVEAVITDSPEIPATQFADANAPHSRCHPRQRR